MPNGSSRTRHALRSLLLLSALTLPHASAQTTPATTAPVPAGLSGSVFKLMGQVGTPPAASTPKAAVLTFKPSAQVRQKAIDDFLTLVAGQSPDLAAELRKTLAGTDLFPQIEKEERRLFGPGMSVNNVADAWATYWGYAWLMTRRRTDDPTPRQMQGLRAQFQSLLLQVPGVTGSTDAARQQLSDPLTLQVVLYGLLAEAWKDHPQALAQFGNQLAQTSRDLGFDLTLLTLTDQGFVVQKK